MLILTRRPAETIHIGDEITVTVLGVFGNQVRFGINAPRAITIDRAEIRERKIRGAAACPVCGLMNGAHKPECPNTHPDVVAALAPEPNGNVALPDPPPIEAVEEVNGNTAVATHTLRRKRK
jgi:carbon storage regulator